MAGPISPMQFTSEWDSRSSTMRMLQVTLMLLIRTIRPHFRRWTRSERIRRRNLECSDLLSRTPSYSNRRRESPRVSDVRVITLAAKS